MMYRASQVDSSADGFSNAQLKEHYSSCIKLSTENVWTIFPFSMIKQCQYITMS